MTGAQRRAEASARYWRAEKAELAYVVAKRGESRRFKRNRARADRRVARILESQ